SPLGTGSRDAVSRASPSAAAGRCEQLVAAARGDPFAGAQAAVDDRGRVVAGADRDVAHGELAVRVGDEHDGLAGLRILDERRLRDEDAAPVTDGDRPADRVTRDGAGGYAVDDDGRDLRRGIDGGDHRGDTSGRG